MHGADQPNGEKKDAARRRFDRWAVSYERDRRSRFNARPQREALAALRFRSRDRSLGVGCGSGAAVRAAAAVAERAVGVRDLLTARIADLVLRRLDRSHVRLYRGDESVAFLRSAGFSDVSVSTLYRGGYAIVGGRRGAPAGHGPPAR